MAKNPFRVFTSMLVAADRRFLRLVLPAGEDLGRRRRHRRGTVDPHQPPHAAGARHRRPVRADGGAWHHHDRRDPGPAGLGGSRRPAAVRPRSRRWPRSGSSGTRTARYGPARCGSGSVRSSSAVSLSPLPVATSATGWSPRPTPDSPLLRRAARRASRWRAGLARDCRPPNVSSRSRDWPSSRTRSIVRPRAPSDCRDRAAPRCGAGGPACCCEPNDIDVLSEVIGRPIADPTELYAAQQQASLDVAARPSACPPSPSTEPEPHEETP